jgi:hypothetical protein
MDEVEAKKREGYQETASKLSRKEKVKGVSKLLYLDVIVRTSGYSLFLGMMAAVLLTPAHFNWLNAVAGFIVLILMQGLMQHSLDTISDNDPVDDSKFRKFAIRTFTMKELKRIYITAAIASTIIVIFGLFIIKRWLIIIPFILGMNCIFKYAKTGLISYPAFGWSCVVMTGWLLQADLVLSLDYNAVLLADMPIICLCLVVFAIFQVGQVLYKVDDSMRIMNREQVIAHQRNNLRYIHHQTFLPIFGFIFAAFGYYWISLAFAIAFLVIWTWKRHHICNNVKCKNNGCRNIGK